MPNDLNNYVTGSQVNDLLDYLSISTSSPKEGFCVLIATLCEMNYNSTYLNDKATILTREEFASCVYDMIVKMKYSNGPRA